MEAEPLNRRLLHLPPFFSLPRALLTDQGIQVCRGGLFRCLRESSAPLTLQPPRHFVSAAAIFLWADYCLPSSILPGKFVSECFIVTWNWCLGTCTDLAYSLRPEMFSVFVRTWRVKIGLGLFETWKSSLLFGLFSHLFPLKRCFRHIGL